MTTANFDGDAVNPNSHFNVGKSILTVMMEQLEKVDKLENGEYFLDSGIHGEEELNDEFEIEGVVNKYMSLEFTRRGRTRFWYQLEDTTQSNEVDVNDLGETLTAQSLSTLTAKNSLYADDKLTECLQVLLRPPKPGAYYIKVTDTRFITITRVIDTLVVSLMFRCEFLDDKPLQYAEGMRPAIALKDDVIKFVNELVLEDSMYFTNTNFHTHGSPIDLLTTLYTQDIIKLSKGKLPPHLIKEVVEHKLKYQHWLLEFRIFTKILTMSDSI